MIPVKLFNTSSALPVPQKISEIKHEDLNRFVDRVLGGGGGGGEGERQ